MSFPRVLALAGALCALAGAPDAIAAEYNGKLSEPRVRGQMPAVSQVIVQWRETPATRAKPGDRLARTAKLAASTGVALSAGAQIAPLLDVVQLQSPLAGAELEATLQRLRADDTVLFAEPDERRFAHLAPNDSLYASQWYLQAAQIAAVRAETAWDRTVGSATVIVAVLDTGVRFDHPDLAALAQGGKLLPGFDFVSLDTNGSSSTANDGNGRDADPSDPGDWIDSTDIQNPVFISRGCSDVQDIGGSSWHGTRVSGIIGARTNNAAGMAGLAWDSPILPLRVLGKCGGNDSDILAAMRWAAGFTVPGIAQVNPNPARIINLSLGSDGACRQTYVTVMQELTAAGVTVVASAGNDGGELDAPSNCPDVISVGALRHIGTKVGFSNVGTNLTISAPGGNCVNVGAGQPCLFSLDTATDTGDTVPLGPTFTDQFNFNVGTSFSAPIVSGSVALMRAAHPALPLAEITRRLRRSARAFPTTSTTVPAPPVCHVPVSSTDLQTEECICTTSTCGAGMLDTGAAVVSALRPLARIQAPASVSPGQNVALDATASIASPGRTIASFEWTALFSSGAAPTITGAGLASASVPAPASGEFALRLTVTDSTGAQDVTHVALRTGSSTTTTSITVSQDAPTPTPPPPPPPSGGGGGGGGGSLGLWVLALLAGLASLAHRQQQHVAPGGAQLVARAVE